MAFLIPAIGGIAAGAGGAVAGLGTTAAVATGLGAAAMLGQGVSAYQQGEYNRKVYNQEAQQTLLSNEMNERTQRRQFSSLLSSNRAKVGASGIEMTGSPLEVEINNIFEFESDLLAQRYNADVKAKQLRSQGTISSMGGRAAFGNSLLNAGAFTAGKLLED